MLILGHGASGNAASMQPHVQGLRRRGVEARAIDLPKGDAARAMPRFIAAMDAERSAVSLGGHSFGGRVASMVAAERGDVTALVLFSYPLHRPGHPEAVRTEHWPRISCPVLLLSGESDPFARIDLLRDAVTELPHATLITYPRIGHGLLPVLDEALDEVAAFLSSAAGTRA